MTAYLTTEQVAAQLDYSRRTITELVRTKKIPHRKIAGVRRVYFLPDELDAWMNGATLETVETANGGRVVRPKGVRS